MGFSFQRPDSDSQHTGVGTPDWMETVGRARGGSPSETKGVLGRRDTGKAIDSKFITQICGCCHPRNQDVTLQVQPL